YPNREDRNPECVPAESDLQKQMPERRNPESDRLLRVMLRSPFAPLRCDARPGETCHKPNGRQARSGGEASPESFDGSIARHLHRTSPCRSIPDENALQEFGRWIQTAAAFDASPFQASRTVAISERLKKDHASWRIAPRYR